MKFCIALLTDYRIHNYARHLAYHIDQYYGTGMDAMLLPQHVTVAPVFAADDLGMVETYFNQLAAALGEIELMFPGIELKLTDCSTSGVIWLKVVKTPQLAQLQQRLVADMAERGWRPDYLCGDEFEFHSTVAMGNLTAAQYQKIMATFPDQELNLSCRAREIALFCPIPSAADCRQHYFTYKIWPLGRMSQGTVP
jgi:2'-5' RNA ligase